jgi:hypothetical protein
MPPKDGFPYLLVRERVPMTRDPDDTRQDENVLNRPPGRGSGGRRRSPDHEKFMKAFQRVLAVLALYCLTVTGFVGQAAQARTIVVTNLAHLDFLLDKVSPPATPGHTTYRFGSEPDLLMPWTYADARAGGTFERIGGGGLVPGTSDYRQGAFNTDDVARAAVVYLRHWKQTGSRDSRNKAYELLRSVAYMQTVTGPNRGRSVLWIQSSGQLNPSPEIVEQPNPSDSGPSYWQARTLWAYGEGYADFRRSDPAFAHFLAERLRLSVRALNRDVLNLYGHYRVADGKRVPAWLIVNGADATAEAVLGLSAYVGSAPREELVRTALAQFSRGIAEMSAGDVRSWPYGAILPWAESRSVWHAWASQTAAALARSSAALDRLDLLRPAVRETVSFDPTLLTAGGPDNGWLPAPIDRTQIAYGVDSRVQSLLAVADVGHLRLGRDLAALQAGWFFGANRAGMPMYDPETGVTFDGLQADGTINRNSGAESTIHGLLTMIALDAHPGVRERARRLTAAPTRDGLRVVEAEAAPTTGTVVTPTSPWTGESQYSGGAYVALDTGETASFDLGPSRRPVLVEPVSWQDENGTALSRWRQGDRALGTLRHRVGAQGITAQPGALLPQLLPTVLRPAGGAVEVRAVRGPVRLDALLVRPVVSRMTLRGSSGMTELLHSASARIESVSVGVAGKPTRIRIYDSRGRMVQDRQIDGRVEIRLPAGGVAVVVS